MLLSKRFHLALLITITCGAQSYAQEPGGARDKSPPWEIFAMPSGWARGGAGTVAMLSPAMAESVYVVAVRRMQQFAGRACLEDAILSHGGGYTEHTSGDPALLRRVASALSIAFPCRGVSHSVELTVSHVYRVDSASVRVFVFLATVTDLGGFAAEDVFLLRRNGARWEIVASRNVMIT